jgi:2-oxoglutarate ferredoxin oxidoreductase subunit alpha
VAYGTVARVCLTAIEELRQSGLKVGLIRPVSLFPFPYRAVADAAEKAKGVLVVELSTGQMLEDVQLAVQGKRPIRFHGRTGGHLVTPEEAAQHIRAALEGTSREVRND